MSKSRGRVIFFHFFVHHSESTKEVTTDLCSHFRIVLGKCFKHCSFVKNLTTTIQSVYFKIIFELKAIMEMPNFGALSIFFSLNFGYLYVL